MKETPPNNRNMGDSLGPVVSAFAACGATRRNLAEWRIAVINGIHQPHGSIHGLPGTHGQCLATDGIECLILTPTGTHFYGHFQHFIPIVPEREKCTTSTSNRKQNSKAQERAERYR